jgi:hypothetical protein
MHSGHHSHDLMQEMTKILNFTQAPVELSPDYCPDSDDKAFVNFGPEQLKDPKGFHGMLFFGEEETFYISHLPMYHKPHDYQAIMEVRLPPAEKARYQAALRKHGGYFTFAPSENFVLPEVVVKKLPIQGTLFQGHFERGGKELLDVQLELVRVVYYRKLTDDQPQGPRHAVFGQGNEFFLVNEITRKNRFDEIIPIKGTQLPQDLRQDVAAQGVSFIQGVELSDAQLKFSHAKKPVKLPYQLFYREVDDLH